MPKTDNNRQDFSDQDSKSQEKEVNQSEKGETKEASFENQDDESNVDKEKAYGAQAQRFRERYKKAIKENETLQSQIDELQKKFKSISDMSGQDDLESQVKSLQDELTSLQEGRKKEALDYEVKLALSNADCIDVVGAMAHLDRNKLELKDGELAGLDVKKLKKDLPHLFKTPNTQNSAVLNQGELGAIGGNLPPKLYLLKVITL